jgi:hypothetical protein
LRLEMRSPPASNTAEQQERTNRAGGGFGPAWSGYPGGTP